MSDKTKEWISVLSGFLVLIIFSCLMIIMIVTSDTQNDQEDKFAYVGIALSILGTLWLMWALYFLKLYSLPVCKRREKEDGLTPPT